MARDGRSIAKRSRGFSFLAYTERIAFVSALEMGDGFRFYPAQD
jgi:hypothetical protein